jgi:hypothetical protein
VSDFAIGGVLVQDGSPWLLKARSWTKQSEGGQPMRKKCGPWYIVSRLGAIT